MYVIKYISHSRKCIRYIINLKLLFNGGFIYLIFRYFADFRLIIIFPFWNIQGHTLARHWQTIICALQHAVANHNICTSAHSGKPKCQDLAYDRQSIIPVLQPVAVNQGDMIQPVIGNP